MIEVEKLKKEVKEMNKQNMKKKHVKEYQKQKKGKAMNNMDIIDKGYDISCVDADFRLTGEDTWVEYENYGEFIEVNRTNDTYSIIPKVENFEKRIMLLICCSINEKIGFYHLENTNFILEVPKAFEFIIKSLYDLEFEFCIFGYVFSVKLNYSASHFEISYGGIATNEDRQVLYDVAYALYDDERKGIPADTRQEFWNE